MGIFSGVPLLRFPQCFCFAVCVLLRLDHSSPLREQRALVRNLQDVVTRHILFLYSHLYVLSTVEIVFFPIFPEKGKRNSHSKLATTAVSWASSSNSRILECFCARELRGHPL